MISDSLFKTYSFDEKGFDFDKVPYTWLLYLSAVACAAGLVAWLLLPAAAMRVPLMLVFLCMGIADMLFTTLNLADKMTFKRLKLRLRHKFYFAAIIDLLAFVTLAVSMFVELPKDLNVVTIWLIGQLAWACYISSTDQLIRVIGFLNGLSVFALGWSLVFFIWADTPLFIASGLLLYTVIRLTIALAYREKRSRMIKGYKPARFVGQPTPISK